MTNPVRDLDALTAYLDDRLTRPFDWGHRANDCISFFTGAVKVQNGRDLPRELGVDWTTAIGARRVLNRLGGVEALGDRLLKPVPLATAMRGDGAMVMGERGPIMMVVEGETLAGPGPNGAMRLPRSAALRCWSID